ncbi:hypothetical protein CC78DRAFT_515110 [Lojkania enalia]|uniref:Uncharacterized protein n=1 Tax=Lojkania enalia TaxID=147567 RepID=A0A9P4N0Y6_9PLEO|nr:hypothetical protein CC78DRAFT_515110 [Didymosphaeria enalia]
MSSEPTSYAVHLGFWTNWSHGRIQGATITLSRQNGGFLIAFLALFVGLVGKSFWRLACFSLHRYFSSSDPQDGLYHQRQAILRNCGAAQDGAWQLLMSLLAWKSGQRAARPIARLLPLMFVAIFISVAFTIASIFSAYVTTDTLNEVLLKGDNCGLLDSMKPQNMTKNLILLQPYNARRASEFLNYGLQCYTNSSNTDGCNLYIKRQLPLKSSRNATCPFGDDICKLGNDNLLMDTGYLDSLRDFGINTGSDKRFQMRFVQQCAPIKTEGYTEEFNDTQFGPVTRYFYGAKSYTAPKGQNNGTQWTYEIATNNSFIPTDGTRSSDTSRYEYALGMSQHQATYNETLLRNKWQPIPALYRTDADVSVVYLSAPQIRFSSPVDDPLFSAHKNISDIVNLDDGSMYASYLQDDPLTAMACTIQMQYCNPNRPEGSRCEPLRGLSDPRKSAAVKELFGTGEHFDIIKHVENMWVPNTFTITSIVGFIGASALRARYGLSYGYQGPLPDNQWQIEAEHWFKGTLASLQDAFVTGANGPPAELYDFLDPPAANETVARTLCANQKIVSTKFSSFNILGVCLILVLGSLVVVLDWWLEPVVAWWLRRRFRKNPGKREYCDGGREVHPLYSTLEWSHMSTLQLQRLAHEAAGYGIWSSCDSDTPITLPGQRLAAMSLKDVKHPVLKRREGSPREWDAILHSKSFALQRSDTGMSTLVEEGIGGEEKAKDELNYIALAVMSQERGPVPAMPYGSPTRL